MTYTYSWNNGDKTFLKREDPKGNAVYLPVDEGNTDYAEFLTSGATAFEYVAPLAPAPLTATEKLAAAGLTVDELKELLDL